MQRNRRDLLQRAGILIASTTVITGCQGLQDTANDGDSTQQTSTPKRETTTATEIETPSATPEETESETVTEENTTEEDDYISADNIQETGTLNLVPADEEADYAESTVFEQYNGEIDVELDLNQAIEQRHYDNSSMNSPIVEEFINNIDDPEWREELRQESPFDEELNWEVYQDSSRSYEERMRESGMIGFWYMFENETFGGVSSGNNQYKAAALQGAEQTAGFDTFVWDYGLPGHGMVGAIENPTRNEDETDQQETYVIQTDYAREQQIVPWDESVYREGNGREPHPAHPEVDRREEGMYTRTAIGAYESDIHVEVFGEELVNRFINFHNNPESSPAYDHLDPMAAAAFIAEENTGSVSLTADELRYRE